MLSLYLDTLIIGHKVCSMFIILNEVTVQKELQNFMTMAFGQKNRKTQQQQNKKANKHPCQSWELNPGPLAPPSDNSSVICLRTSTRLNPFVGNYFCYIVVDNINPLTPMCRLIHYWQQGRLRSLLEDPTTT